MANYCTACHNPIEAKEVKDNRNLYYHPDCLKKERGELPAEEESDFAI